MNLKPTTRRARNRNAERRLQAIEQFHRSGSSIAAFSRQHGIPLSTLSYWLRKEKRTSRLAAPVVFSEVRLGPPLAQPVSSWAVELVSPDGLTVRCRDPLSAGDLALLLRG